MIGEFYGRTREKGGFSCHGDCREEGSVVFVLGVWKYVSFRRRGIAAHDAGYFGRRREKPFSCGFLFSKKEENIIDV